MIIDSQKAVKVTERSQVPTNQLSPMVTSSITIEHFKTRKLIGTMNTIEYKSYSAFTILDAFIFCVSLCTIL